jgi:hypothetical protein
MTILIHFHQSHYRDFKAFYTQHVLTQLLADFPGAVSYPRFVELIPSVLVPLSAYLETCRGRCRGLSFVDSTKLVVCHNRRIKQHRVFAGLAGRGKDSVDWFYGFKLHLIVTDEGDLLACRLTPGNMDDRRPVPQMAQRLFGKLIGDKGYLSQVSWLLSSSGRKRGNEHDATGCLWLTTKVDYFRHPALKQSNPFAHSPSIQTDDECSQHNHI